MPSFRTLEACLTEGAALQTVLALSKVRLYQSTLVPTPSTPKTALVAAEADYDDYPAGGSTITAFLDPIFNPAGGASISAPTVQFDVTTPAPTTPNLIGGAWLEDAGGDVHLVMPFAAPVPMDTLGQGFPLNITIGIPTGQGV